MLNATPISVNLVQMIWHWRRYNLMAIDSIKIFIIDGFWYHFMPENTNNWLNIHVNLVGNI